MWRVEEGEVKEEGVEDGKVGEKEWGRWGEKGGIREK